jgi:PQQ-dependent catabolism-associated CXXCW motif protein
MNKFVVLSAAALLLAACDSGSKSTVTDQLAASAAIAPGTSQGNGTRVANIGLPPLPGDATAVASNGTPPSASLQSGDVTTPSADAAASTGGDDGAPTEGAGGQRRSGGSDTASYTPVPTGTNYANEAADFGVAPQKTLKSNVGSQTPTSIPGGRTITTANLAKSLHDGLPMLLIDAWDDQQGGSHATLPGAKEIPYAGQPGSFSDATQTRLETELQRLTKGDRTQTLVFFCQGAVCWEAYNAALRAMHAGYDDVVWYRGGLPAWTQSGGQLKVPNQG